MLNLKELNQSTMPAQEKMQQSLKVFGETDLLTIKDASVWASDYLKKDVTPSNISYLIQYGRVRKVGANGSTFVSKQDLMKYYDSYFWKREISWKG